MRTWVYLLFFASGVTGLLYQIVWIRAAGTVLGNTTYAIGTVVGVYMGGMALGAWSGGRAADRRSGGALLRLYGLLEGGVALSAFLVPWLIGATAPLFRALWDGTGQPGVGYAALRVAVPALILAVPTTLMGATLPVLARFFAGAVEGAPREAGKAYALNTFGGVVGTLAAGFWLVPAFGLRITTLVAVLANAAIAAAALLLARGAAGATSPAPSAGGPLPRAVLWMSAASGLAGLIYEVAWTRMIVLSLGSTVYSFTLVLAVFIFGLAAGSALGARWVGKSAAPERALGLIQLSIGALALIGLPFLGNLPVIFASVMDALRKDFGGLLLAQAGLIIAIILPPTLLMGAVFPFACRLAVSGEDKVGRSVAGVYTWNTLGSIVGTFVATFLIVPLAGPGVAVKTAIAANLATAAGLLWAAGPAVRGLLALPAVVAAIALFVGDLKPEVMSAGAYLYGNQMVREARQTGLDLRTHLEKKKSRLVESGWDAYGLVTVQKTGANDFSLRINGKVDASTSGPDMVTQQWLAHLPLLHHPDPKRALVIGLGAGITAGTAAEYALERVDCVEISPAVARMARHFAAVNGNCLENPKVRLTVGDGRHLVRCARQPYDVIICEPSNLWLSGMANLFTRDFFQEAAAKLAPGGVLCQWIHAYKLSEEDFRSVLRTFFSVFPGGGVWEVVPGGDYLLLGRLERAPTSWASFSRRMSAVAPQASELTDLFLPAAVSLASTLVADAERVRAACGAGDVLTDDHCRVEFTAPRSLHTEHRDRILAWLDGLRGPGAEEKVYGDMDAAAKAALAVRRAARRDVGHAIGLYMRPPSSEAGPHRLDPRGPDSLRALDEAIRKHGPDRSSRLFLELHAQEVLAEGRASAEAGHADVAAAYLDAIPRITGPYADARLVLGNIKMAKKDVEGARADYVASLEASPRSARAAVGWAAAAQALSRKEETLEAWTKALSLEPNHPGILMGQAAAYYKLNRDEEARAACKKALQLKPDDAAAKELLKRIEIGGPR
ncbi:MAG TPA: fused MFS/spermidine synthase [Planctomycetota bacterium]